ncbi:eukaryotic translation initiation factor 3 subunit C-like isoform X1 [Temnothorax curvispinosus]|uniref:Eukaryotic translation initiation factor 3 subunit C-like isoform X1 n=1 Tax=Temnothorax curvispinosus TaxID=300111 RepID=A0A6J1PRC1_9HYME|nr:eukaryotic translation initiation factor 3 subunit C-like isoform X1 [Temnothorax curvispinosus]
MHFCRNFGLYCITKICNIGTYYGNNEIITEEMQKFETTLYKIYNCVLALVERLDEEFIKLLKECDLHSNEYVERYIDNLMFEKI